jgi:GT2 family glycosyltransferase
LTDADRAIFRKALERPVAWPLISVVMPVYQSNERFLRRAIDSVLNQIYPHWELCISDDASTMPHVRQVLEACKRNDARIRVIYRGENGHISANSNSALSLATGDYVALLDADDELPEHALFWVANEVVHHPDVDLIFSDEDKLEVDGARFDPYFKSDWNPALMLSQNAFSHLGVFRRSLVESVGGFRVGLEGSQDHDLVLRCAERTTPERIRHIPRILYHWRAEDGSTASLAGIKMKPYAREAGARAIREHLGRTDAPGVVRPVLDQFYQVDYRTPTRLPKVSIVIPTAFARKLVQQCLSSVLRHTTYDHYEILIAINEKSREAPDCAAYLRELEGDPRIRVLAYPDQPFNYSAVNNWAVRQATGSVICLLNDDVEIITPDWLERLVARVELPGVGAVGCLLHYPNDTIQHAGVILGLSGVAGHAYIKHPSGVRGYFGRAALEQDLSCVTAACVVLRREAFEAVGGFDERLAIAFNDVDLCIRLRQQGWRIIWTPTVELRHHESASTGRHDAPERIEQFQNEVRLMRAMWGATLDRDPAYNANLSLISGYDLAFPPRIEKLPEIQ